MEHPKTVDPERFVAELVRARVEFTIGAFGLQPRCCPDEGKSISPLRLDLSTPSANWRRDKGMMNYCPIQKSWMMAPFNFVLLTYQLSFRLN